MGKEGIKHSISLERSQLCDTGTRGALQRQIPLSIETMSAALTITAAVPGSWGWLQDANAAVPYLV